MSTYDFSTLYTTLPYNLIKEKLTELIEQTFNRESSIYLACNDKNAFFTSEQPKRYKLWSRFGSKLYRQIVGIPMGTNCAPLVADLFLFCCERDFMLSLSDNNQTDIIEAFNSTSRLVGRICNNFEMNLALYDKSMKLGTWLVDNKTKQLRVSATPKKPSNGRHLVFSKMATFFNFFIIIS